MEIVVGLAAFAIVAGWAALAWFRHGRDPDYGDDPSILQSAPPPEMTAATATIVSGGSSRVAFEAALLDLASRDEIAFRQGTGADAGAVGIEIHGGSSTDPAVLRNRRRPVGEGEAWLLGQLRLEAAIGAGEGGEAAAAGGMMAMLGSLAAFSSGTRDGSTANAGGMLAGAALDPDAMAAAYASRHGAPMPAAQLDRLRMLSAASALMAEPGRFGDPAAIDRELAARGVHLTPEQEAGLHAWLAQRAAVQASEGVPAATAGDGPVTPGGAAAVGRSISPALARALPAPLGFASLVESYARRHGWVGGLSFIERWKWRALGAVEAVVGLIVASAGGWSFNTATALGVGIGAGGVATWLLAPVMPARTASGAMMVAQLRAYERTLRLTFGQAGSMNDVVGASGLAWLETPDQVLVWGVALGLRPEIEALLRRATGSSAIDEPGRPAAYVPAWYRTANDAPAAAQPLDPARMFAAIEAIGTQPGGLETLAHAAEAAADSAPPVGT